MDKSNSSLKPEKLKSLLVISGSCSVAGILWGLLYAYLGLYLSMCLPFLFSVSVGSVLFIYKFFRTETLLLYTQLSMILIVPIVLQWTLGGFHKSGVVGLWSMVAPFGAIIFQDKKKALLWTVLFGVLLTISFIFDSTFQTMQTKEISPSAELFFYGMNITGTSMVTFGAIYYYNLSLEKEYTAREIYLQNLNNTIDIFLKSIEKMAAGDLTAKIDNFSEDENLIRLVRGYNEALELMKSLLIDLEKTSFYVTESITKISSSLDKLETQVNQFSAQFDSVESQLHKLQKTMNDIQDGVSQNRNISNKNITLAGDGGKILIESVSKIEDVTNSFQITDETVKQLEKISLEIGDFTSSINEISESTNLLALNASIEAARAGAHGRGFSVVAREIGNLTNSTTDATQKIGEKVKEIQKKTKTASEQFSKSNYLILDSVKTIKKLQSTIENMIQFMNEANESTIGVSSDLEKEMLEIQNFSVNILDVFNNFKSIFSEIEQIESDSNYMNQMANDMMQKVKKFKIHVEN